MKLLKLIARNFKGIREFVFEPNGADASVFGANAAGKTTLFDASNWLLFGKDSNNRADFDIKTLDENNNPIHMLEHEVEGVFRIGERTVTLTRCYEEQWTRRRGSAEQRFTGHQTGYHIDGVPKTKREFDDFVASIAEESVFRLLSDPTYFNEHLHWEKQRELIIQVAGDVSDEEVVASDKQLAGLQEILTNRTLDEHRKVVAERRKKINEELKKIPVRIDEADRGLPELPSSARADVEARLDDLRHRRDVKYNERMRIQAGGQVAEYRKQLAGIEAEMVATKSRVQSVHRDGVTTKQGRLHELRDEHSVLLMKVRSLERERDETLREIERGKQRMAALKDDWHRVDADLFSETLAAVADACVACEQPLPTDRVEEARKKAVADLERRKAEFNERKAARLADITEQGKRLKAGVDAMMAKVEKLEAERDDKADERDKLDVQSRELLAEIEALETQTPDPMQNAEYARLAAEKAGIEATITALQEDRSAGLAAIDADIRNVDDQIQAVEGSLARFEAHERGKQRIAELKAEERKLAAEFERLEHELHLADEFTKAKVRLLDKRINSKFKIARFKMFVEQVNGGIEPTCQALLNGVPWNSINGAGKIQVGLDIINTLAEHYGFAPPVFIDDAVTITDIPSTTGQQIRLVVSADDKTLRVVTDGDHQLKEAV